MDVQKTAARLAQSNATISMFADGFIDEVWELVSSRTSSNDYTAINQMKQLAERIATVGTGGMAIELVKKRRTIGGFTANIGDATARLGVNTILVGLYGKEKLDPLYDPLSHICRMISLGDPAVTHALEFDDGKILMTHIEAVSNLHWSHIVDAIGTEEIISVLTASDIIGVGYWSSMPYFDDTLTQICTLLPQDGKQRRFFFDFADVRKKDEASLVNTLQNFKILNKKYPITLSLNEHEAAAIFGLHDETLDEVGRPIPEKLEFVRKQIDIDELVVHTPYYAAASFQSKSVMVRQRFCKKPVRSAGAGDTFNGGYIAAVLAGLNILERLHVANAAVSYFLNNGHPPDQENLINEIKKN